MDPYPQKRGRGRPRNVYGGGPGRPRKVFHPSQNNNVLPPVRRPRGRPRKVRSGGRGRPKNVHGRAEDDAGLPPVDAEEAEDAAAVEEGEDYEMDVEQNDSRHDREVEFENPTVSEERMKIQNSTEFFVDSEPESENSDREAQNRPEREEPHLVELEQPIDEPPILHEVEGEVINDVPVEAPARPEREEPHLVELEQPIDEPPILDEIEDEVINDGPLEANRPEREELAEVIYMGSDAYTGPAPRPAPIIPESQRKPRLVPESILTRIPDGATEEWELWTREQVLQWSSLFLDTEGQRFYMKKKNFTGLSMAEFLDNKDWDDFDSRSPINGIYISLRANLNRIINHCNGWTHDD